MLAIAIQAGATAAWGQVPHLPGTIPGNIPGDVAGVAGSAQAAAMMHFAQMLKLFDQNGNGQLDPHELALAHSGMQGLLGQGGNGGAAAGNNPANLLPLFDRNGNGQLDTVEMEMAQLMMAMLIAAYNRPVNGVAPMAMPMQAPLAPINPPAQPARRGRRKRAERIADFAKINNAAPVPKAGPKKKNVKARGPMVEQNQPRGAKAGAANAPAND